MTAHGARPKFMAGRSRFRYAPIAAVHEPNGLTGKRNFVQVAFRHLAALPPVRYPRS